MKNMIKLTSMILSFIRLTRVVPSIFGTENYPGYISEEKLSILEKHPELMRKVVKFARDHKISIFASVAILSAAASMRYTANGEITTDNDVDINYNEGNPAMFINEMIKRVDKTASERENAYCSGISIDQINYISPHHILGSNIDENDIRNNPKKYFEQDKNGYVYIKDTNEISHCAGRFFIRSLGNLRKVSKNVSKSEGKLIFVYGNKSLLDSCNCLNSKKFDLANVASNHNGIETLYKNDFEKKFKDYPNDPTQAPRMMIGFSFPSFVLLHLFNGRKIENHTSPLISCEMFATSKNSYELNLLKGFGITTSAGYIDYESLKDKSFKNDQNFCVLIVEEAPLSLKKISLKKESKSYKFQAIPNRMTLFIAAAIPKNGFYGSNASEYQVKKYLQMYYESLFRYCESKEIKNALITPIGIGVFGIPIEWHFEILNNIQDLIKQSGTTYWINGYDKNYDLLKNKYGNIKFENISNMKSIDEMMNLATPQQ